MSQSDLKTLIPPVNLVMAQLVSQISVKVEIILDARLSRREKETLCLAAAGYTAAESASLLAINPQTVEQYRQSIKKKLQCKPITQAVVTGIKYGYLPE